MVRRLLRPLAHLGLLAALLVTAAAACAGGLTTPAPRAPVATAPSSNMLRGDYAGSRACTACHAEIAESFVRSAMHNMTRDAKTAHIAAPFDGAVFRFKDDQATFETTAGEKRMTIASKSFGDHVYRITKVIGGHHREDFAGVEIVDGKPRGDEEILPVSYVLGRKELRYKGYSVMSEERPGLRAGPTWRETCIFCHNTVPYFSTILGALLPPEQTARAGYQAIFVDRFLPEENRLTYRVADGAAFAKAVRAELDALGSVSDRSGDTPLLLARAISETRTRFDERHLVELGVGCESCHNGARAHAESPAIKPTFAPKSDAVAFALPSQPGSKPASETAERAQWINRACARCHQVLFSGYTPTWEGGLRNKNAGGSHINSGEARDMILGGCASELSCTTCHDPHGQKKNADAFAAGFANDAGDRVCGSCHGALLPPAARAAHTKHRAEGEGSHCVSCHMPRKNMGLDGRLTRYHRVGSPNDPRKIEQDRPIECALCHTDKTAGALLADLERLWPARRYDKSRVEFLYGGLDQRVLIATLARGKAHEQAVAAAALGEVRDAKAGAAILPVLTHEIPLIREYGRGALEGITGQPLPVSLNQARPTIQAEARAWLERALPKAPR